MPATNETLLKDSYGRTIRDLRVSLTDRCNFRCFYCLPHGEPPIAPKEQMLSYEEIERACEIFVSLGIEKIRLTGGEPMLRRDIETIITKLAKLKDEGIVFKKLQIVDPKKHLFRFISFNEQYAPMDRTAAQIIWIYPVDSVIQKLRR